MRIEVRNERNNTVLKKEGTIENAAMQRSISVLTEFLADLKPRNPRHSAAIIRADRTCPKNDTDIQEVRKHFGKILAGEPQKLADIIGEGFERERLKIECGTKWFDENRSLVSTPSMIAARVRTVNSKGPFPRIGWEPNSERQIPNLLQRYCILYSAKLWRVRGTHPCLGWAPVCPL